MTDLCTRCRRPRPVADSPGAAGWEPVHGGTGLLCPGCASGADESLDDDALEQVIAEAHRAEESTALDAWADALRPAQLAGEACVHCGRSDRPMAPLRAAVRGSIVQRCLACRGVPTP